MTIKQHGGVFGRNPKFNNVSAESLTIAGNAVPDASTILVDGDIGSTVQGYDADTAKYDDATANFTGTLQNGGSNVLVDTDIGSNVQAYDADTAKLDVAQTFTAAQTFNGNIVMANGQGIDFSATGNGSGTTDNELFDDYEEGTWTPTYVAATNFSSITHDIQNGEYTKIGNVVFINLTMRTDAVSGGSGAVRIEGLPFTPVEIASATLGETSSFGTGPSRAFFISTNASIFLYKLTAFGGNGTALDASDMATGTNDNLLRLSGFYII